MSIPATIQKLRGTKDQYLVLIAEALRDIERHVVALTKTTGTLSEGSTSAPAEILPPNVPDDVVLNVTDEGTNRYGFDVEWSKPESQGGTIGYVLWAQYSLESDGEPVDGDPVLLPLVTGYEVESAVVRPMPRGVARWVKLQIAGFNEAGEISDVAESEWEEIPAAVPPSGAVAQYILSYEYPDALSTSGFVYGNYVGIVFEDGVRRSTLKVEPAFIRINLINPPTGADIQIGAEYSDDDGVTWHDLLATPIIVPDGGYSGESSDFVSGLPDLVHGFLLRPKTPAQVGSTTPGSNMTWGFWGWEAAI